jgi:polyhydroxyalkanoate synthase
VPGVSVHNAREVSFLARQILDQFAPSNFVASNPVVLRKTFETGGKNLWNGGINFLDDLQRVVSLRPPAGAEAFRVGETIACTPGSVVFRNELIEVLQYSPKTDVVHPEPILIVPAWIMKYFILDLSPANSLVRHLVEAGHTVFMISWRNPRTENQNLGMDDYLSLGINDALATVKAIVPDHPIHAVGYCLGGTLVAITTAALGRHDDRSLKTLTLLAAQTDFADAGELTLFIDESEVTFLEDLMWQRGLLEARQMAGAFHLLRSNDLIWSRMVRDYLLGGRTPMSDLMAWNADATHMPYRMHSEYLRRLFLSNDLASGRYVVGDTPVGLSNIDVPMFVVATAWDHVAPWKSVYKIHLQADVDITFVLSTGGHNVGIVNPPNGSKREYRIGTHPHTAAYVSPERWLEAREPVAGSWWPAWVEWLKKNSSAPGAPPTMGAPAFGLSPIEVAPGSYVFER